MLLMMMWWWFIIIIFIIILLQYLLLHYDDINLMMDDVDGWLWWWWLIDFVESEMRRGDLSDRISCNIVNVHKLEKNVGEAILIRDERCYSMDPLCNDDNNDIWPASKGGSPNNCGAFLFGKYRVWRLDGWLGSPKAKHSDRSGENAKQNDCRWLTCQRAFRTNSTLRFAQPWVLSEHPAKDRPKGSPVPQRHKVLFSLPTTFLGFSFKHIVYGIVTTSKFYQGREVLL